MKKNSNEMSTGAALLVTVGIMLFIGFIMNACEPKCSMAECDNKVTTTKKKMYTTYDSYDEGYEDVYEDDDYDWDRYQSDSDYADGVDDAMDELDW